MACYSSKFEGKPNPVSSLLAACNGVQNCLAGYVKQQVVRWLLCSNCAFSFSKISLKPVCKIPSDLSNNAGGKWCLRLGGSRVGNVWCLTRFQQQHWTGHRRGTAFPPCFLHGRYLPGLACWGQDVFLPFRRMCETAVNRECLASDNSCHPK